MNKNQRPFIFTINCTKTNSVNTVHKTTHFRFKKGEINALIDYGDGTVVSATNFKNNSIYHIYEKPGIYDISITGTSPTITFGNNLNRDILIGIKQWGNVTGMTDWSNTFVHCEQLEYITATDAPILKRCDSMFFNCKNLKNFDASNWDLTKTTTLRSMFENCKNIEDINIKNWNVSNIRNMSKMFLNCYRFNSDISNWDVSNVRDLTAMLYNCKNFNIDLTNWNLKNLVLCNHFYYRNPAVSAMNHNYIPKEILLKSL